MAKKAFFVATIATMSTSVALATGTPHQDVPSYLGVHGGNAASAAHSMSEANAAAKAAASATLHNAVRTSVDVYAPSSATANGGRASVGNVGASAVSQSGAGGAGGNASLSMQPGAVSQQGASVSIHQGDTKVRAGALSYSATQPANMAGGMVVLGEGGCVPTGEIKIVAGRTIHLGEKHFTAAGNVGTSGARNLGGGFWPFSAQAGNADAATELGFKKDAVPCVYMVEEPPLPHTEAPAPAKAEVGIGTLAVPRTAVRQCYRVTKDHPESARPAGMTPCTDLGGVRTWTAVEPGKEVSIITDVRVGGDRYRWDSEKGIVRSTDGEEVVAAPSEAPANMKPVRSGRRTSPTPPRVQAPSR